MIRNLLILGLIFLTVALSGQNRIQHNGQNVFLSGMNLAWLDFSNDLTSFNEAQFTTAMEEISAAGGNSVRWWLHITGRYSPSFTNDSVAGISTTELENLEKALDIANDHKIALILCLWSFDMMVKSIGDELIARNRLMLEDEAYLNAYINNALIPMLEYIGNHPAVLCWEAFNEPEGMSTEHGWSHTEHTAMSNIQRFVNKVAGAVHRTVPGAKVSNGCWSFIAGSDIGNNKNYYSDSRLIEAGGDADGTLDFYMVHYYDWAGTALSPFHHPASYWELDKPLVIAEFSANGPYEGIDSETAYKYLYNNGYAGALSWTWTNHDGHGGVDDAEPGMMYLYENHTGDVVLPLIEFSGNTNYSDDEITVYPIPAMDYAGIHFSEYKSVIDMAVYNMNGELIENIPFYHNVLQEVVLNTASYHPGIFFVRIETEESVLFTRFLKQ